MKSLVLMTSIFMLFLFSCRQQISQPNAGKFEPTSDTDLSDDDTLGRDVKIVSEDVGEEGQKAWQRLRSVPRDDLIHKLLHIRSRLAADDPMQPQIAFVLCNLDYEYRANAEILASALSRNPKYRKFYADEAAALISILIDRGDKTLLPVLLSSAEWADGALAEQLNATIAEELIKHTDILLAALADQPRETRIKAYRLISGDGVFSSDEKQRIKKHLRKIGRESKIYSVAQELLESVFTG